MVYVRHRDRMIQESVFEDLRDTLIAFRWLPGTTSRAVYDPQGGGDQVITTSPTQTLALLEGEPLKLIDYFPESERGETPETPTNTFALDQGRITDEAPLELGSRSVIQQHTFNMAFYAGSDALAYALFNDLRDRYRGLVVSPDHVPLFNYLAETPTFVQNMEVDSFRFERSVDNAAAAHEAHLYFAELVIEDVNES